jgi:hypothetical protein
MPAAIAAGMDNQDPQLLTAVSAWAKTEGASPVHS